MKKYVAGFLVVLFVALGSTVFAFGPGGFGGCRGGGYGAGPGIAGVDLSKEQLDKMWQLKDKFYGDTKDLRYQMFQKRLDMRTLYADPKTDSAALLAKQKELNALRQKMQDKMAEFKIAQRQVLTPEQLQKYSDGSFGRGHGRGAGRGDCGGYGPAGYSGRGFGGGRGF